MGSSGGTAAAAATAARTQPQAAVSGALGAGTCPGLPPTEAAVPGAGQPQESERAAACALSLACSARPDPEGWRARPRGHMCFLADAGAEQGGGGWPRAQAAW